MPLGEPLPPDLLSSGSEHVVDLLCANPTAAGLDLPLTGDWPDLREVLCQPYAPVPQGSLALREAIQQYYLDMGRACAASQIVAATSTSEAYGWVFKLLGDAGDRVLLPAPGYPLLEDLAIAECLHPAWYRLFRQGGEWRVDLEHFAALLASTQPVAVVVVSPHHPLGCYWQTEDAAEMLRLCQRHGVALVVDEVFRDYPLEGAPPPRPSGWQEVLSFSLSGLSKVAAFPQLKVSWMVVDGPPPLLRQAMQRLETLADHWLPLSSPGEALARAALASRHARIQVVARRVRENLQGLDARVEKAPGWSRLACQAGWFSVLECPDPDSDEERVRRWAAQGALTHPGHFYHFPRNGYVVVSLLDQPPRLQRGLDVILQRPVIAPTG